MRKTLGTIVGVVVLFGGLVLQGPWKALDVFGRISYMLDSPDTFNRLIDWLEAHPGLAADLGPWILIGGGVASLVLVHWKFIRDSVLKAR